MNGVPHTPERSRRVRPSFGLTSAPHRWPAFPVAHICYLLARRGGWGFCQKPQSRTILTLLTTQSRRAGRHKKAQSFRTGEGVRKTRVPRGRNNCRGLQSGRSPTSPVAYIRLILANVGLTLFACAANNPLGLTDPVPLRGTAEESPALQRWVREEYFYSTLPTACAEA